MLLFSRFMRGIILNNNQRITHKEIQKNSRKAVIVPGRKLSWDRRREYTSIATPAILVTMGLH
jgi:hypothetical protein